MNMDKRPETCRYCGAWKAHTDEFCRDCGDADEVLADHYAYGNLDA